MNRRVRQFAGFWYTFIVGDDWQIAVGVVVALTATFALSRTTLGGWWVMPSAVAALLSLSVWRASRRAGHDTERARPDSHSGSGQGVP